MSTSGDSCPSRLSRTQPPTTSARPPASRTALAISIVRSCEMVTRASSPFPLQRLPAEALDDAVAEARREQVEPYQRPRFEQGVHLRRRALDGARDRLGDRVGILPRAWPAHHGRAGLE